MSAASRKPTVLVVDGNTAETNAANVRAGGTANATQYAGVLRRIRPDLETVPVHPSEDGPDCLPPGAALADFDGIAWTGSALNVYENTLPIRNQLRLAERAWRAGVPVFGSCWGLQVFTVVLGGKVRMNPRGRELGIARCIHLTEAGRDHPMYADKPPAFDAIAVHTDEVQTPPPGAILLASNAMSRWQAMAVEDGDRCFWGVQYHPEADLEMTAMIFSRYGHRLIEAGLFEDDDALARTVADWRALHADPARTDLAFRYGITAHVTDRSVHEAELRNWLETRVQARASRRG